MCIEKATWSKSSVEKVPKILEVWTWGRWGYLWKLLCFYVFLTPNWMATRKLPSCSHRHEEWSQNPWRCGGVPWHFKKWHEVALVKSVCSSTGEVMSGYLLIYIYTYIILIIVRITLRLDYKCIYANYFCKNSVCEGKCILWQIITGAFCVMACLPPRYSVPMLRIDSHWYHQAR